MRSTTLPLLGLAATLAISAIVAIGLGPVPIPADVVARIVVGHLTGVAVPPGPEDLIVWQIRAPRVVQGLAVGAALAVAGAVAQVIVRNPVADPSIIGLSAGASVGAVTVLTMTGTAVLGLLTLPFAAFVGATAAGLVVFVLARGGGALPPARLIMTGIAVGQLLGGVTSFLLLSTRNTDAQQQVLFWLLGSLAGATWPLAGTALGVTLPLLAVLVMRAGRLDLLTLNDDATAALGVNASRSRGGFFVAVGLLTGTAVAVSGSIGFVGLVVPNVVRLLVGADHRRVLPISALAGAIVLVWADVAARLVLAPTELPIGILTAAIGVPVFVYALRRSATGAVGVR